MANESSLAMDGLHSILSVVHEVPILGAFSRHVFQSQKREWEKEWTPIYSESTIMEKHQGFLFFPLGILALLHNSHAVKWQSMT